MSILLNGSSSWFEPHGFAPHSQVHKETGWKTVQTAPTPVGSNRRSFGVQIFIRTANRGESQVQYKKPLQRMEGLHPCTKGFNVIEFSTW